MTKPAYSGTWRKRRLEVFEVYGRDCWLSLAGCTRYADTVDHLDPVAIHGNDVPALDRLRPACLHCNSTTGALLGASIKHSLQLSAPAPSRHW